MPTLRGTVVSNKMLKTLVVRVDRLKRHPKYRTSYRASKKFKAHVEDAAAFRVGDVVRIQETRPISKEKRWKVVELVRRSEPEESEAPEETNP